jgi:hypothetical protein
MIARYAILTLGLAPYAYFGARDVLHHARHRPTPPAERLLHLAMGITLLTVVTHACQGNRGVVLLALTLFMVIRATDEYVFHRGLAAEESSLHAKTHMGFMIFIVSMLGADWLESVPFRSLL